MGYGDAVPRSWKGKMVASFCAVLGISFFALPAVSNGENFPVPSNGFLQESKVAFAVRRRYMNLVPFYS